MEILPNEDEKPNSNKNNITSAVFVACLFLGMGIGWLTGKLVIGMFIGMGIGLLLKALVLANRTKN